MKKIINGKKYDTDSATIVCCYDNGYFSNDFNYCREELYRKKTGEFFIYGEGGANSIYSKSYGKYYSGGSEIKPITEAEAKEFVAQYGSVEEYEELFGEVEE